MLLNSVQKINTELTIVGRTLRIKGLVQGVGFRPTVWRLAQDLRLTGHVLNDGDGVLIHAFGSENQILQFISDIEQNCPPLARIDSIEHTHLEQQAPTDFSIITSDLSRPHTGIAPDAASCSSCISETLEPNSRYYNYPFTNCTHCGPRLSIINAIPYDRQNTSMASFKKCPDCEDEYNDPANRRFHAQPVACPSCGPKIWLEPAVEKSEINTINVAANLIKQGSILAIKGISGFHLVCDASNDTTVARLRQRKNRKAKPFALMARNINIIKQYCLVNTAEADLLKSPAGPIVLLDKKGSLRLANEVADKQNTLGFMLPTTPLHHLLLQDINTPLVMTSGNPSGIPQCIDNNDAIEKLQGIADYWLLNNRDITSRVDDSVVRVIQNKPRILRRSRGYAPTSIRLPAGFEKSPDILACGAELKNTFCLVKDGKAIISQHMGDLENAQTYADYEKNQDLYQALYAHEPSAIVIDAHPEYLSSKYGQALSEETNCPLITVHHHHAHFASCLADNQWGLNEGKVLGVTFDGLGLGADNTLWGGEFLLGDYTGYERLGSMKQAALMGGSQAIYQPWRNTYAQLKAHFDWDELNNTYPQHDLLSALNKQPLKTLNNMLEKNLNSPLSSSCGRLFDAVAAAIGICRENIHYEGQAAIELEACVTKETMADELSRAYKFDICQANENSIPVIDSSPLWNSLLVDIDNNVPPHIMSARFHHALINATVDMVCRIAEQAGTATVALTGGVFQNALLLRYTDEKLTRLGYKVLTHSTIPANDSGLCLGQATIALAKLVKHKEVQPCA